MQLLHGAGLPVGTEHTAVENVRPAAAAVGQQSAAAVQTGEFATDEDGVAADRQQAADLRRIIKKKRSSAKEVLGLLEAHSGFGVAVLHWFTDSPSQLS
ncbi:MAG: hypothetical protein KDI56_04185, partial [Xanthomonadales bacterium]|nr:hypothetical protein [Xanthomonadales bacterium]